MQRHVEFLFRHIETKQRYCVDDPTCLKLMGEILRIAESSTTEVCPKQAFYRAQRGCVLKEVRVSGGHRAWVAEPFDKARMIPTPEKVSSGRVSPAGIPVLYLAENLETAVQEMRPVPREILSVATFNPKRKLRVVQISGEVGDGSGHDEWLWMILGRSFSRPVLPAENPADYAPTQYIAECLKNQGYDGIAYKSSFNTAWNYAFFDITALECQEVTLRQIENYPSITSQNLKKPSNGSSPELETEINGLVFRFKGFSSVINEPEYRRSETDCL